MTEQQIMTVAGCSRQRGFVLVVVFSLILLISGLGLIAMRHARQEARSAGDFVDTSQAVMLAESAMAVSIADLRRSSDYYQEQFFTLSPVAGTLQYAIPLNSAHFDDVTGSLCAETTTLGPGCIPVLSSPFLNSNNNSTDDDRHRFSQFHTSVLYDAPLVGPCPPGYSCFDDQNYGWYVFGIRVTARYGAEGRWLNPTKFEEHGRAVGMGRITLGPIGIYGR